MTDSAPPKTGYQPGILAAVVTVVALSAIALAGFVLVAHEGLRIVEYVWAHT